MLGPDDLVLCAGTVPHSSFRARVDAAAAAGFRGITMRAKDWARARDAGLTPREMRDILDDNGLYIGELDAITHWLPHHADARSTSAMGGILPRNQDIFWEIADTVGARALNVAELTGYVVPAETAARAFGSLCDRAAAYGLLVHLEPLPWSGIPDLTRAARIAALADRPNGGILLDTWHHFRAGGSTDDLDVDVAAHIIGIQLSDAPAIPATDLAVEAVSRRLLPGYGDAEVARTVRNVRAAGVDSPIGIEVMSDELAALPAIDVAARVADAARAVIAAATDRGD